MLDNHELSTNIGSEENASANNSGSPILNFLINLDEENDIEN